MAHLVPVKVCSWLVLHCNWMTTTLCCWLCWRPIELITEWQCLGAQFALVVSVAQWLSSTAVFHLVYFAICATSTLKTQAQQDCFDAWARALVLQAIVKRRGAPLPRKKEKGLQSIYGHKYSLPEGAAITSNTTSSDTTTNTQRLLSSMVLRMVHRRATEHSLLQSR